MDVSDSSAQQQCGAGSNVRRSMRSILSEKQPREILLANVTTERSGDGRERFVGPTAMWKRRAGTCLKVIQSCPHNPSLLSHPLSLAYRLRHLQWYEDGRPMAMGLFTSPRRTCTDRTTERPNGQALPTPLVQFCVPL